MSKKILLTFDYELFLYQSGSLENCILKPVQELLSLFDKLNIKGVFFIDILYLKMLRKDGLKEDENKFCKSIHTLVEKGHQVELHLHPHWLDATYESNKKEWNLSNSDKYRLQSLSPTELEDVFTEGYNLLTDLCKQVDNDYKITAYRAGGLCIQPFDVLQPLFEKFDIKIDSSVASELKSESKAHFYDFTKAPKQAIYNFSNDPTVIDKNGQFIQIPIFSYQKKIINKISGKLFGTSGIGNQKFGDGKAVVPQNNVRSSVFSRFKADFYMYSLDGDYDEGLLLRKMKNEKNNIITIIAHPKLLSKSSLKTIELMHNKGFTFATIKDVVNS